jgi:hypothetical protein
MKPSAIPLLVTFATAFALASTGGRAAEEPKADFSADIEARKSYWLPAAEIIGFDLLLNQFNRRFVGPEYKTSWSSIRRNLRSSWTVDDDQFKINQLGHPYQGSLYHGFARSAGLNYWESSFYTFAGSVFWEVAGETTQPSWNDQIASGFGGSFLGESLYRMASLLLERGDGTKLWREVGAAAISPSLGFNRLAFDRYDAIFASRNPVYYSRFAIALSGTTQNEQGAAKDIKRGELLGDFSMDYGLPGKPGYSYRRPFDYFAFQVTASSANAFENVMTRGLLFGRDYEAGPNYRGIWGLYGSYDYIAPQLFRVSSTALSLGNTGQLWLSNAIALQSTVMAGLGYAAVGTVGSSDDRDYHYGAAPQALVALRLIFGERASLDLTGREYFVSRVATSSRSGHDNIVRADVTLTMRIQKQHALAIKYLWNRRDATYPDLGDRSQTRATLGIYYTLLGHDRFGAVEWR